ncbi:hypothetical protein MBLNU457_5719t1 [Dothideomycetes sp. NU457]
MAAAAVISPVTFPELDSQPWPATNNALAPLAPGLRHSPSSLHESLHEPTLYTYAQCWTLRDTSNAFAALARSLAIVVTAQQVAQLILRKTTSLSLPVPADETKCEEDDIRDYTTTSQLALRSNQYSDPTLESQKEHETQYTTSTSILDLDSTHGWRQHGKKADKKAQKAAQRNKWLDSDDEGDGNKDGGDGQGAGGGNGSGGDNPGGSGGGEDPNKGGNNQGDDDDNAWNMGSKKQARAKKKKAAAFSWDALDDEGEKEGADGADPAVVVVADAPAEANIEDEWKEFETTSSKKKKRKGKVADPEPIPPPPPPAPDVKAIDKIDILDDIDLGTTTKLDLNFDDTNKKSSFGFGSWGGGWGASDNKWDFSGAGNAGADPKEESKVDSAWASFGTGKDSKQADPEPAVEEDPWGFTKSKKKKKGQQAQAVEPEPVPEPPKEDPPPPAEISEPAAKSEPALGETSVDFSMMSAKDRKKAKKAAKAAGKSEPFFDEEPVPEASVKEEKPEDVVVGSIEEPKADEDDLWPTWSIGKKSKRGKVKNGDIVEVVATPPAEVLVQQPDKESDKPPEDDIWGWSSKTSKVKSRKKGTTYDQPLPEAPDPPEDPIVFDAPEPENDPWESSSKSKVDEDAFAAALGDDLDDLLLDEPSKTDKGKDLKQVSSKTSKVKGSKKGDSGSGPSPKSESKVKDDAPKVDTPISTANDAGTAKSSAGWIFWGSSLKSSTTPAKDATPKMPEVNSADHPTSPPDTEMPKASKDSKSKTSAKGSVAERIKALESDKKVDDLKSTVKPDAIKAEEHETQPDLIDDAPAKTSSASKDKLKVKHDKRSSKLKDVEILDLPVREKSSPLPGGFPTDDLLDETPPSPEKVSSKSKKSSTSKTEKSSKSKSTGADNFGPPREDILREVSSKSDEKDVSSPGKGKADKPKLSRSKSERKPSDVEPDKAATTSDSDKVPRSDRKERPSASRGMSFSGMFGMGSTPSRSKSTRQSSSTPKSSSKRHSVDIGDLSPPKDIDPKKISGKAADILGTGKPSVGRRDSRMEKRKSKGVPDPYAIDDDDVVMVDVLGDDVAADESHSKERRKDKVKSSKSKAKRESTYMSGALGDADAVLVDASEAPDGVNVVAGPDGFETVEKSSRPALKRSNTTSKRTSGFMSSLFGSSKPKKEDDFIRTRGYESEDAYTRRKRSTVEDAERAKRLRRENRKVDRPSKTDEPDGHTDAAPGMSATEAEEAEKRRAERRARRAEREAAEVADAEKREAERKERRVAREARRKAEEEAEARRVEEKRKRRAEREARYAAEEQERRDAEAKDAERRARRREEERSAKPKTERRRSHTDYVERRASDEDAAAREARREERRLRRSAANVGDKDRVARPSTHRRRSEYPADTKGDDYFAPRPKQRSSPPATTPYMFPKSADKTSSWVASVSSDPPPPPPAVETVIDHKPGPGEEVLDPGPAIDEMDEKTARELRRKKRMSLPLDEYEIEAEKRRRRKEERRAAEVKSRSGESDGDAIRRRGGASNSLGYDDMGSRTFDGRGASSGKRNSLFGGLKKMAGFY